MPSQLKISRTRWNKEFASGRWDYLDNTFIERARHAVIGMFCQQHTPNGKILDVGCGEGTLSDFLNSKQRKNYLGIDISEEALTIGKKKRRVDFQLADAEIFEPSQKFDVIVFNEMLYYVDDRTVVKKFSDYLNRNGHLVISVYRTKASHYDQVILRHARTLLTSVDAIEITGLTKNQKVTWHIEIFQSKNS